jgi:hypothetical protein
MKIHGCLIWIICAGLAVTSLVGCSKTNPLDELEEWDLVYISDSTGTGVAEIFAQNIERDTGKTVRIHDHVEGGLPALGVLLRLQNDQSLQSDIAEAEVIVFFGNPEGVPSLGGVQGGIDACMEGNAPEDCTLQLYEPYIENLKTIYEEIFALRNGQPTIIRAVGFYNPLISEHRNNNVEIECTQCWETFNLAIQEGAAEYNIPFVSVYDAFNGVNHDEDPREKGYISSDGEHTSKEGRQVIADILSEAGYEPVEP